MKKLFITLLSLSFAVLTASEFVKNADFSSVSPEKLPTSWSINANPGSKVEVNDGVLTMKPANEKDSILLIQHGIKLPYNTPLMVSYDAMAEADAVYRIYIEGTRKQNGKTEYCSFILQPKISGTGIFETIQDVINIPDKWQNPYIVIRVIGNKAVSFKNLQIKEINDIPDFNFDFAIQNDGIPLGWGLRGKKEQFKFSKNLAVLTPQGQNIAFINYHLNQMIPGVTYHISLDVRGDEGDRFKAYAEWSLRDHDGKYVRSSSSVTAMKRGHLAQSSPQGAM